MGEPEQRPESSFHERLAYARLLKHVNSGRAPSNAEIGRAVGATGQWLVPWTRSERAPGEYDYIKGLLAFFQLEKAEAWFVKGAGEPPLPRLWALFIPNYRRAFAAGQADESPPATVQATREELRERSHPAPAKRRRNRG